VLSRCLFFVLSISYDYFVRVLKTTASKAIRGREYANVFIFEKYFFPCLLCLLCALLAAHLAIHIEDLVGQLLSAPRADEASAVERLSSKNDEVIIKFLATSRAELVLVSVLRSSSLLLFFFLGCRRLGLLIGTAGTGLTAVQFAALALEAGFKDWVVTHVTH